VQFGFLKNTNIDFIGKRYIFFAISGLLILAGVAALVLRGGPNYGIDFSGGILMQVSFAQPVALNDVRSALSAGGIENVELQSSGNAVIVRAKKTDMNEDEFQKKAVAAFQARFVQNQINIERVEFVGPAVGHHLGKQAFYALIFSFIGIIVYVAFRFHSSIWGAAGVIGIMHDVFITFGLFVILDKEITLTIIAALLTIAGYSINDTIVIFDRIRENLRYLTKESFGAVINRSINETLSRTMITSLTVFFVVLCLYFLGGQVIHDFAFAMVVGTVIGVYSTVFVCTPLVYEWEQFKHRNDKKYVKGAKK
jgi:preprotein translocase subunit SecF